MGISADAIWGFAELLNREIDSRDDVSNAMVTRIDVDGKAWVRLDGSSIDTPANGGTRVTISPNDSVLVTIKNGVCTITNNRSYPNATASDISTVNVSVNQLDEKTMQNFAAVNGVIQNLEVDTAKIHSLSGDQLAFTVGIFDELTADEIDANKMTALVGFFTDLTVEREVTAEKISATTGFYDTLTANEVDADKVTAGVGFYDALSAKEIDADVIETATEYVGDLYANNITTEDIEAATGYIGQLTTDNVTAGNIQAATAFIADLDAENVTAADIAANKATIGSLDSNYAHITHLDANTAVIDNAKINYSDVKDLNANYANISLANVNNAWINNGTINTAAIVDEQVFTVTGNKATLSEINADNITVRNLNAKNLKIETADGYVTIGNKKTPTKEFIDSLKDEIQDKIDSTVETYTSNAVPLTTNYPASQWTTDDERLAHVGDICFVTNSASQQNGFCYRYAYDSTNQTFSWVLIKDSDVTKALGDISTLQTFKSDTESWIEETDEGLRTIRSNHTTLSGVVDKTVKASTQLWFTKANTTAPAIPTAQVTTNSTSTANKWNLAVPTYNASYPNYFYCWQYQYVDGTYGWSAVIRDVAMGESQERARTAITNAAAADTKAGNAQTTADGAQTTADTANTNAAAAQSTANANIKSSVQLWYTSNSTTPPAKPTAKVTATSTTANAWTNVVPTYSSSTPNYHYCYQQQLGNGNWQWTDPTYDSATSVAMKKAQEALPSSTFSTFQSTTFKELVDEVDEQSSTITTLSETTEGLSADFANIKIGGTNLLRKTHNLKTEDVVRTRSTVPEAGLIRIAPTTSYAYIKFKVDYLDFDEYGDGVYTVSCDVKLSEEESTYTDSELRLYIGFNAPSNDAGIFNANYDKYYGRTVKTSIPENWTRYSLTLSIPDDLAGIDTALASGSNLTVQVGERAEKRPILVRHVKLEKGNKATEWAPAPEDMATEEHVTTVSNTVNTVKQTADSNVSKITNLTTTLGTNADGTTSETDIVHRTSAVEQDLEGITTRVGVVEARKSVRLTMRRDRWTSTQWEQYSAVGYTGSFTNKHGYSSGDAQTGFDSSTLAIGDIVMITGVDTDKSATHTITAKVTAVPSSSTATIPLEVIYSDDTTGLSDRVTTAETTIQQNSDSIALKASVTDVYQNLKPNLAPLFGSSPYFPAQNDYWVSRSNYEVGLFNFTDAGDGWVRVQCDASASSSYKRCDMVSRKSPGVEPDTDYTLLFEFRNNHSVLAASSTDSRVYVVQTNNCQFWGNTIKKNIETYGRVNGATSYIESIPSDGTVVTHRFVKTSEALGSSRWTDGDIANVVGCVSIVSYIMAGDNVDFEMRVSIYEGEYTGPYKPYSGTQLYSTQAALEVKANKDTLTSEINASADTVTINADRVNIAGATIFTEGRLSENSLNGAYDAKGSAASVQSNVEKSANSREQTIYRSAADGTASMSANTTWVTASGDTQNAWTTRRPTYNKSYPVLFVAYQRQTVAQSVGTTCSCTTPTIDNTTTVIDGGRIITGSVTANKLDVADINASNMLTVGSFTSDTSESILNSNVHVGGRNLLFGTRDPEIKSEYSTRHWNIVSGGNGTGAIVTVTDSPVQDVNKSFRITGNTSGNRDFAQIVEDLKSAWNGSEYTDANWMFSAYVRAIGSQCSMYVRVYEIGSSNHFTFSKSVGTSWERLEVPVKLTGTGYSGGDFGILFGVRNAGEIEFIAPKLERGTTATDWSPAPEDQTAYVDNLQIGGRNLLLETSSSHTSVGSVSNSTYIGSYKSSDYFVAAPLTTSTVMTYSFDYEVIGNSADSAFIYPQLHGVSIGGAISSNANRPQAGMHRIYVNESPSGHYWATFMVPSGSVEAHSTSNTNRVRLQNATDGATLTVSNMKLEFGNRATDWLPAPEDVESGAVARTQRIYYRSNTGTKPTAMPTAWVTETGNKYNANATTATGWSTKVTPITSSVESTTKYIYLWTCEQREMMDGTLAYTNVLLDDSTTIIDGGNIITGTVTANQLNATNINGSGMLTIGSLSSDTQSGILNSEVSVGGRNLLCVDDIYCYTEAQNAYLDKSQYVSNGIITYERTAVKSQGFYITNAARQIVGETYTVSFDIVETTGVANTVYIYSDTDKLGPVAANTDVLIDGAIAGKLNTDISCSFANSAKHHVSVTYVVAAVATSTYSGMILQLYKNTAAAFNAVVTNLKWERGNKETDWSPAPEDVNGSIVSVETTLTDAMNGFVIIWDVNAGTSASGGEANIRRRDPKTGNVSSSAGWAMFNGTKRTIPTTQYNPNKLIPYNIPVYFVLRLTSATADTGALYAVFYQDGWKTGGPFTALTSTYEDWTWDETTDMVLGRCVEPSSEGSFTDCFTYDPPVTYKAISTNTVTAVSANAAANAAQNTADTANNKLVALRGTCATAAGTAAKEVVCTGFSLVQGSTVSVYNTTAQTVAGAITLNVNSSGAKAVWVAGAATSDTNRLYWSAGSSVTFVYDGTQFRVSDNPGSYYGTTCSVAETTAAKTTTVNDSVIFKGVAVSVPMTNTNTAASPTLNVSALGACNIYYGTSTTGPTKANGYAWPAGTEIIFIFDGKFWRCGNQTFIDGGNILTGTVTADQLNANSINSSKILTVGSFTDDASASILNSNISVGGRNLLLSSGDLSSDALVRSKVASIVGGQPDPDGGTNAYLITPTASTWYLTFNNHLLTDVGETYTFSVWLRADTETTCRVAVRYLKGTDPYSNNATRKVVTVTTDWQQFSTTGVLQTAQTTDNCWIGQLTDVPVYAYHPKTERGNVVTDWSPAPEDVSADSVKRTQRIYYRSNVSTAPTTPSAWVTEVGNKYNTNATTVSGWSTKITPVSSGVDSSTKYIYLWTCEQREMADGTIAYTNVLLDDSMTVIDGGNIVTGSITANKLDVSDINAKNSLTIGALSEDTQSSILNSNVSIGGRNLLAGTKDFSSGTGGGTVTSSTYLGFSVLSATGNSSGYVDIGRWTGLELEPSTEYTLSFYAKASANTTITSYLFPSYTLSGYNSSGRTTSSTDGSIISDITTSWQRIWITWTTKSTGAPTSVLCARIAQNNTNTVYICGAMLEKGNKATDWTPAPEDVDSSIDGLTNAMNGFTILWDKNIGTSSAGGEATICLRDPVAGTVSASNDGWVMFNGTKRTIPHGDFNPNTALPYNIPIYMVFRLSSATSTTGALYAVFYQSGWKCASKMSSPSTTYTDWTWENTTDIILGKCVEPSSEAVFTDCEIYDPPLTTQAVSSNTITASLAKTTADNAKTTADNAKTTADSAATAATNAAKTATNYIIYQNATDGIKVTYNGTNAATQITSSGVDIINSSNVSVASFGSVARLGEANKTRSEIDYHSLQLIDKEGSAYFYVSDLRDSTGYATLTETFVGDGSTKAFDLSASISTLVSATDSSDSSNTGTRSLGDSGYNRCTFTNAPAEGAAVTVVYKSSDSDLKAHTFGFREANTVLGKLSVVEGNLCTASGSMSHAEGNRTMASSYGAHAEGDRTTASGHGAHAEGADTYAIGWSSHAEGQSNTVNGTTGHVEGWYSTADGVASHAEGYQSSASGSYSHAEGYSCTASTYACHAEGDDTEASGQFSHAEGWSTTASGLASHAEGYRTTASGDYNHAEGGSTEASGQYAHAEGRVTTASGLAGHAEGYHTTASGSYSHAEGNYTTASGSYSHAEGYYTVAKGDAQHVMGKYNVDSTTLPMIVGWGGSSGTKTNIMTLSDNGTLWISSTLTQNSDRRLKTHHAYLGKEASTFMRKLRPALFTKDGERHLGFYAQDVQDAEPENWDTVTVKPEHTDESLDFDPLTLDYTALIAPLTAYAQQLEKRVEYLESTVDSLVESNEELREMVETLIGERI